MGKRNREREGRMSEDGEDGTLETGKEGRRGINIVRLR